jgi:hypothetical protein
MLRNAYDTTILILAMAYNYGKEKDREITRFAVSHRGVLKASGRRRSLRRSFRAELEDTFGEMGWEAIPKTDGGYALVQTHVVDGWVAIGAKRIADDLRALRGQKITIGDIEKRIAPTMLPEPLSLDDGEDEEA